MCLLFEKMYRCLKYLIFYPFKKQCFGGHRLACLGTMSTLNNPSKLLKGHAASPHFYDRTDNGPYHIPKKSIGTYLEIPLLWSGLMPLCMGYLTERGLDIASGFAKRTEIVIFHQYSPSLIHESEIELIMHLQAKLLAKGILAVVDIIMVGSGGSRKTSMFIGSNRLYLRNSYIVWQYAIEALDHVYTIENNLSIEMCSHLACMNSCVSSSCSCHVNILTEKE